MACRKTLYLTAFIRAYIAHTIPICGTDKTKNAFSGICRLIIGFYKSMALVEVEQTGIRKIGEQFWISSWIN